MTDLAPPQKTSRRLWFAAALVALALHLGGAALAVADLRADETQDELGAPAIEIGLEMSAPRQDSSDLPPGPDSDVSVASPAMPEQKAELDESDLPRDTPTETDDPDRVVTSNEVKEPVKEEAKVAAVQTSAAQESPATQATAVPSLENTPQGQRSVAPAQGPGESAQRAQATWEKEVALHFDRHKRYPAGRERKGAETVVGFVLDRMGHVHSASIVKGSGDPAFDEAALTMVRRSDPVPRPPPAVADEGLSFTLPVIFRGNGKS